MQLLSPQRRFDKPVNHRVWPDLEFRCKLELDSQKETAMKHLFFNPRRGVVSVKRGFSWPAFLFGSLWATAHRMWFPHVLALLPLEIALWLGTGIASGQHDNNLATAAVIAALMLALVRGQFGNRWLAASLRQRGYEEAGAQLLQA